MSSLTSPKNALPLAGVLIAIVVLLVGLRASSGPPKAVSANLSGTKITVYKSPTCGCCANYIAYLKRAGLEVETITTTEMEAVKNKMGVPTGFTSCHTSEIGGYTAEGHIPLEALSKLVAERPSLAGIALPGMPSGSPGMPGAKQGPWSIYGWSANTNPELYTES
ncbi:CopG family transcriptional regulator [Candidatus Uhrbacteria bacterium]|nr:CopG family transcriptional regulator [Candidatus Uhrbacteria bacterium]